MPRSSHSSAAAGAMLALVTFVAGCLDGPCPAAETAVQYLDVTVHTEAPSSDTWLNKLDVIGSPSLGMIWSAAAMNSASVSPSVGLVMVGDSQFNKLWLGIPFPCSAGDTFALTATLPASGPDAFRVLASGSGATLWLDTCAGTTHSNCALAMSQEVQGTLTIETSTPLSLRIDAAIMSPTDSSAPVVEVHGEVSFSLEPRQMYCLSRGD